MPENVPQETKVAKRRSRFTRTTYSAYAEYEWDCGHKAKAPCSVHVSYGAECPVCPIINKIDDEIQKLEAKIAQLRWAQQVLEEPETIGLEVGDCDA